MNAIQPPNLELVVSPSQIIISDLPNELLFPIIKDVVQDIAINAGNQKTKNTGDIWWIIRQITLLSATSKQFFNIIQSDSIFNLLKITLSERFNVLPKEIKGCLKRNKIRIKAVKPPVDQLSVITKKPLFNKLADITPWAKEILEQLDNQMPHKDKSNPNQQFKFLEISNKEAKFLCALNTAAEVFLKNQSDRWVISCYDGINASFFSGGKMTTPCLRLIVSNDAFHDKRCHVEKLLAAYNGTLNTIIQHWVPARFDEHSTIASPFSEKAFDLLLKTDHICSNEILLWKSLIEVFEWQSDVDIDNRWKSKINKVDSPAPMYLWIKKTFYLSLYQVIFSEMVLDGL